MWPDLLWRRHRAPAAVIDAKYKAERRDGFPNADLNQMLAYCTVLDLSDGHLVYAKGNEPVARYLVQHSDITVHCHALDLVLAPAQLLTQVRDLAEEIANAAGPQHV